MPRLRLTPVISAACTRPGYASHPLCSVSTGLYPFPVATILLCGVDLFMRGKLEALLPDHRLITVDHTDDPELVLADVSRVDPEEVADTYPDIPIVGFTNHTDTSGLRAAHAAGFDQVLAKSALDERLGDLVTELAGPAEA